MQKNKEKKREISRWISGDSQQERCKETFCDKGFR